MRVNRLLMDGLMLFEHFDVEWSNNINIICGENSTGKTTILKLLYSVLKPLGQSASLSLTKKEEEKLYIGKMQRVFRPDAMKIGRLVSRKRGKNRADIEIELNDRVMNIGFSSAQKNRFDFSYKKYENAKEDPFDAIYIPTKEMISTTEHFATLYEEYHLDFEEMYYDLAKLLDRPLIKGVNTSEQKEILSRFESIMKGNIIQKEKKFFLKVKGQGEFEMGLLSDGYRKLSTLVYLILSGSLDKNTVLFWDEPETNMNPKMIRPIVQAITALAKMGVQVFISTHDYFIQQEFYMLSVYPEINTEHLDIQFLSLYRDEDSEKLNYEVEKEVSRLKHNAIMQEFDALYDREKDLISAR